MESHKTVTMTVNNQMYLIDGVIQNDDDYIYPKHTIKTIGDMLRVVKKESLDSFLQDLKNIFELYYQNEGCKIDEFVWIDDQQHHVTVNYKVDCQDVNLDVFDKTYVKI
ncbi:MAG TPA: hypothetical protein VLG50_04985 [Candidatus Saccharimonadales bacterium]|nr:hypothetical protein [Candidatus Saccharimonadales bacterium]